MEHSHDNADGPKQLGRRARYDRRQEGIIDAAAQLFAANGYAQTSVAQLCETVGLGKGGLYHYIGSKENLLLEIHERVMGPLLAESQAITARIEDPAVRLRMLSQALLTVIATRLDHVWVFLHEHRALQGQRREQFRLRRREYEAVLEACLADGIMQGQFMIDDVRVATLAFLGMHNYTYQWIRQDGGKTADELSRAYCRLFFAGIAPRLDVGAMEASIRPLEGGAASH